jgi:hypothetical protein
LAKHTVKERPFRFHGWAQQTSAQTMTLGMVVPLVPAIASGYPCRNGASISPAPSIKMVLPKLSIRQLSTRFAEPQNDTCCSHAGHEPYLRPGLLTAAIDPRCNGYQIPRTCLRIQMHQQLCGWTFVAHCRYRLENRNEPTDLRRCPFLLAE